jgi:hypothetical protein
LKVFATCEDFVLTLLQSCLINVWLIPVDSCDIDWSVSGDFNCSSNHDWCGCCLEGKANEGSGWWIPKGWMKLYVFCILCAYLCAYHTSVSLWCKADIHITAS